MCMCYQNGSNHETIAQDVNPSILSQFLEVWFSFCSSIVNLSIKTSFSMKVNFISLYWKHEQNMHNDNDWFRMIFRSSKKTQMQPNQNQVIFTQRKYLNQKSFLIVNNGYYIWDIRRKAWWIVFLKIFKIDMSREHHTNTIIW